MKPRVLSELEEVEFDLRFWKAARPSEVKRKRLAYLWARRWEVRLTEERRKVVRAKRWVLVKDGRARMTDEERLVVARKNRARMLRRYYSLGVRARRRVNKMHEAQQQINPCPSRIAHSCNSVDPEVIKAHPELRQAFAQLITTRRALRNGKKKQSLKTKLPKS